MSGICTLHAASEFEGRNELKHALHAARREAELFLQVKSENMVWAAGTLGTRISAAIRACIAGHAAPMNAMQRRGLAAASPAAGASTSGRTIVAAPFQRPCQPTGTRRATAAWADNAAAAIRVNSACVRRLLHLRPAAVAARDDAATEEAADGVVGAEYDLSPDVFEEGAPPLPKVSRGSKVLCPGMLTLL